MIFELTTEHSYTGKLIYSADSVKYKHKPATQGEKASAKKGTMSTKAHTCSTVQELAQVISQGQTISGAQLRPKQAEDELTDSRILQQQLLFVDIDNDEDRPEGEGFRRADYIKNPEEILAICRGAGIQPCIIYESFSHGKLDPNGDPIPKYHIIFALEHPLTDPQTLREVLTKLIGLFGGTADPALKDPARMLYGTGADKQIWYCNAVNTLEALLSCYELPEECTPSESLLTEQAEPQTTAPAAPRTGTKSRSTGAAPEADPDILLAMIDPNAPSYGGEEGAFIQISSAYKAAGGSLDVWLQWCRGYTLGKKSPQEQERENRTTWKGLRCTGARGAVTIASLKNAAKKYAPDEYNSYMDGLNAELKRSKTKTKTKTKRQPQSPAQTEAPTAAEADSAELTAEQAERNPYDKDGSGRLTRANLENALELMGITVRHNIINHKIEYTGRGLYGHDPAGLNANLPYIIYDKLQKRLQGCTVDKISGFLNVIAFSKANEYNPVLEAISATKWDGHDHLEELYNLMQLEPADNLSRLLLKKWLMQAYCGLHNTLEEPFSLDLILVLVGRQGFGKTRLLEKLALNSKNFGEGLTLDPRDKDSKLQVTSFWLAELGEIGSTMKKDIDTLKAFISLTYDENRPPYSRGTVTHPRRTSYCGTTNDMQFLIDTTGNRRFAVVKLPDDKYIDVRGQAFKQFNALQLWAQIADIVSAELAAGETYASAFRLTREELAQLETRNHLHSKPLKGEEEVRDELYFLQIELEQGRARRKAMTASQFIAEHGSLHKYTAAQIGKVLTKMGFKSMRKKVNGVSFTAYELPSILLTREEGANLAEGLE